MTQTPQDKGQFVQFPLQLIQSREDLSRDDKWVLLALMGTCWTETPHRLSIREIAALSGVPVTLLVTYTDKKTGVTHEGILDRLERTGDIRQFQDKERNPVTGQPKGQTQTYVIIQYAHIWQHNKEYCEARKSVSNTNTCVPYRNTSVPNANASVSNTNSSVSNTNDSVSVLPSEIPPIDYVDYIDHLDHTRENCHGFAIATHDTPAVFSLEPKKLSQETPVPVVVKMPVSPPRQATPTPVVVEAPDVRLTTSEQPPTVLVQQRGITQEKRSPRAKKEETPETVRCREIQAKIDALRGFALKKPGLIIDERKVIRDHLAPDGFTDERITAIHGWIVTNIWKYKSVGGRGDVGARVIWEEAERAEAAMRQPDQRASPPAGRVIPMKIVSDFDDPNFRLEDEFYKPERERGYTTHAQADSTLTPGQAVAYAGATPTVRAAW